MRSDFTRTGDRTQTYDPSEAIYIKIRLDIILDNLKLKHPTIKVLGAGSTLTKQIAPYSTKIGCTT